jgi:hypothetical protein
MIFATVRPLPEGGGNFLLDVSPHGLLSHDHEIVLNVGKDPGLVRLSIVAMILQNSGEGMSATYYCARRGQLALLMSSM